MESFYRIVSLLGGLALFLYGMRIMGDGLKGSSGGALRAALARVTNRTVTSFLLGLLVTCMIQSSTATIVLTVGLVGAGFLTFRQSVGIVLGANVGTAITAQIIRLMDLNAGSSSILYFFKSDNLAPMALVIGIILIMFLDKKVRNAPTIGTIFMGFGILFVGLMNMSSAVSEVSGSLSGLLVSFEDNPFLGFLAGAAVTGIIQSSSAVIGILQSIASSVGIGFCAVYAVIIGVNIGDCVTTYLVCRFGAKPEQIRVCLVHVIYNVCAAVFLFVAIAVLRGTGIISDGLWFRVLDSGGVANVHGLFRIIPAVLFLPVSGMFADLAEKMAPDQPEDEEDADIEKNLRELDLHLVQNPGLALEESRHLLGHMAKVSNHNCEAALDQLFAFDPKRDARIEQRENLLDRMADGTSNYLIALSPYIVLEGDRRQQNFQLKALVCFERIGDLAVNINEEAQKLREQDTLFSEEGEEDLRVVFSAVLEVLSVSREAFKDQKMILAKKVEPMEEVIDELVESVRSRHLYRMTHGVCSAFSSISFENILTQLERISDQCSDLAVSMLALTDETILGREHEYLHQLHSSESATYTSVFSATHEKYFAMLPKQAGHENAQANAGSDQQ